MHISRYIGRQFLQVKSSLWPVVIYWHNDLFR